MQPIRLSETSSSLSTFMRRRFCSCRSLVRSIQAVVRRQAMGDDPGDNNTDQDKAWDDTAIIKTFNAALNQFTTQKTGASASNEAEELTWRRVPLSRSEGKKRRFKKIPQNEMKDDSKAFDSTAQTVDNSNFMEFSWKAPSQNDAAPDGLPTPKIDTEDEALTQLLLSWYYAGYHTGRYQTIKQFQRKQKKGEHGKSE